MKKQKSPILIVGGGLAGLSAAYHLKKPSVVFEREGSVGGTARSVKTKGFTFDFTGHLLHLHYPYTKKLINRLLKNNIYHCIRKTAIFSSRVYTNYPFQANTFGLPQNIVDECMMGYFNVFINRPKLGKDFSQVLFSEWCQKVFGKGISKYFMKPYNEKLYQTRINQMTSDWCGQFVPKPKLEDVIKGALVPSDKKFGYNATFIYPKRGGIEVLAKNLAKRVKNMRLNTGIKSIFWKQKMAVTQHGDKIPFTKVINSIPLLEFLKTLKPLPSPIKNAMKKLKVAGILCINIGVKRKNISDKSWIYFPDKKYPFYRVGFPMNFTPHVVPKGCSSMYVEVPLKEVKGKSKSQIKKSVLASLVSADILKRSDKIIVFDFIPIKYAYVIYDRARKGALKTIFSFLKKNGMQSIGRYGAWKYSFMEAAIMDGKLAAEKYN